MDTPICLPFETDEEGGASKAPSVLGAEFAYIGQGLTLSEFEAYVSTYNFGSVPPSYIVLHHTANPDASYAPLSSDPRTKWDRAEQGMSDEQIKVKRLRQLDGIKGYYQNSLQWTAGPHLFIDDRFIWLFTPMYDVGVHAKWGNGFRQGGRLHYGVGIEVIGYYEKVRWPNPVADLVGGAVRALCKHLPIEPRYMYPTPQSKPGVAKGGGAPLYPSRLAFGGLSSHRDYNKPQCPGAAITEDYYVGVCRG